MSLWTIGSKTELDCDEAGRKAARAQDAAERSGINRPNRRINLREKAWQFTGAIVLAGTVTGFVGGLYVGYITGNNNAKGDAKRSEIAASKLVTAEQSLHRLTPLVMRSTIEPFSTELCRTKVLAAVKDGELTSGHNDKLASRLLRHGECFMDDRKLAPLLDSYGEQATEYLDLSAQFPDLRDGAAAARLDARHNTETQDAMLRDGLLGLVAGFGVTIGGIATVRKAKRAITDFRTAA